MNCTQVVSRLQLFMDEELLYQDMEAIRKHISLCSLCEQRFQTEKLFKQTLRNSMVRRNITATFADDVKHYIMDRAY